MSLVWHIARKDLRRLRVPLFIWIGLIVVKLGLGAFLFFGVSDHHLFNAIPKVADGLIALEVVMGYVLVGALLHGDVVVGTTAFWMTRPISGRRLLAAKSLGLAAVFGVIPVIVTMPWWLVCGYGGRELALAITETLLWQALIVGVALPLAALTDELGRYLMWSLVAVVGIGIMNFLLLVGAGTGVRISEAADVAAVRGILATLVLLIGGGVAAAHQFYGLRLFRSLAIAGVTVVIALLVASSASIARRLRPVAGHIVRPQEIKTPAGELRNSSEVEIKLAYRGAESRDMAGYDSNLVVRFKVEGLPAGSFLDTAYAEQSWRWTDGLTLKRDGSVALASAARDAGWHALGIARPEFERDRRLVKSPSGEEVLLPRASHEPGVGVVGANVPPAFPARVRRDPPSYLFQGHFHMVRAVVVGERPAKLGEKLGEGADIGSISDIRDSYVQREGSRSHFSSSPPPVDPTTGVAPKNSRSRHVLLVERWPALRWDLGWFSGIGTAVWGPWSEAAYFLVNRARGNAAMAPGYSSSRPVRFATVGLSWRSLNFQPPGDWRDGQWVERANWFDDELTLAKVENRDAGWFMRELRVERFELDKANVSGGAR